MRFPTSPRVFITGAGSGLGRALALQFARRNGRVLIGDVNLARARETAALVQQAGGQGVVERCDVTVSDDLRRCEERVFSLWGGTDVLVNNAGVAGGGDVGEMPLADWEWLLRINLFGVIYGCHAFVPRMKEAGTGWVLNIASSGGIANLPHMAAYNVSKAAVISLSETLLAEVRDAGLSVSVLCPTFFKTNLLENFRGPAEKRRLAEGFFKRARFTADGVAVAAVRGLEARELMIIPQATGRFVWRFKRFAPAAYHRLLSLERMRKRVERTLGRE